MRYCYINNLKTLFYIFPKNNLNDVYNYSKLDEFLKQIYANLNNYIDDELFSTLTIEIYHEESIEIPEYLKNNCGLYYKDKNLLQINNKQFDNSFNNKDDYMSNLLSHEFGHHYANYIGFNSESILKNHWNKYRGCDITENTNEGELFAEDFRVFFGSNNAKDYVRGNYRSVLDKLYLKDFMLLFKKTKDYFSRCTNEIQQLELNINNNLCNYMFYEKNKLDFLSIFCYNYSSHWTYIRKDGIWYYLNKEWVKQ